MHVTTLPTARPEITVPVRAAFPCFPYKELHMTDTRRTDLQIANAVHRQLLLLRQRTEMRRPNGSCSVLKKIHNLAMRHVRRRCLPQVPPGRPVPQLRPGVGQAVLIL